MNNRPVDEALQQSYAELQRKHGDREAPSIDAEIVQQLAAGEYSGADRDELLEQILSHPRTAAEFEFFMDLNAARPRARRRSPAIFAAAAAIVIVAGSAVLYRALDRPEALRGGPDDFLLSPAAGASLAAEAMFLWHAVPNAESYAFELADESGNTIYQSGTSDTMLVLPRAAAPAAGTHVWWVTARLQDGTTTRAPPRTLNFR